MSDRDLRLNSLSRYSKESSRLVLEEHSSCEIPAGCGGVVLRWFNPLRALPIEFRMYVKGDVKFALDGNPLKSARPLVDYGEHVVSFVLSRFKFTEGFLMFAAKVESKAQAAPALREKSVSENEFFSDADGSWKYTLNAPKDDSWMRIAFDDRDWQTLVLRTVTKPSATGTGAYQHDQMLELGAKGLGMEDIGWSAKLFGKTRSSDPIWIRKVFTLTPPER